MLKITSSIIGQINGLIFVPVYNFGARPGVRKIPTLHQRIKRYSKQPQKYKLQTRIRPPNLRDQSIQFPIKIPIRYRHLYKPTKPLFLDNTKDIKWQRLSPNQILLAFQNFNYLTHQEVTIGLQHLSRVQGQENYNWNEHPWIIPAFEYINKNFDKIKVKQLMKYYYLLKKLNCKHEEFWKKMYSKLQEELYQLNSGDFEYLFLNYYKTNSQVFSSEMKQKFLKLMEGRLRQFKNSSVLAIFQIYLDEGRLDSYWTQNVFIPLFKSPSRNYTIEQVGQIFRYMMIIGHQNNQRLYEHLYKKIQNHQYKTIEQVQLLEDIISQVKQIFTSHRVQPYLLFFKQQKQRISNIKEQKKLELYEVVKQDLIFFMEKRKIQQQQQLA